MCALRIHSFLSWRSAVSEGAMSLPRGRGASQFPQERNFVSIEFPGYVKNTERAIAMLGHIDSIEKVCTSQSASWLGL